MHHSLIRYVLCFLLFSSFAQAGEMDACYQANFKQIDRVLDLPPDVVGLVYANQHGEDLGAMPKEQQSQIQSGKVYLGIADRGGPFSATCSPIGNEASLRLIMAASSPACVFVSIEHGGAGHGAGLSVFLKENDTWVRGDKFEHPRAQLMYQGAYETDLPTFLAQVNYELGRAFQHGNGVNKDLVASLKWFLLAANQGHGQSQFELGKIYAEGRGTEINLTSALTWFEKAATTNAEFEYRLGALYLEGDIIPQNTKIGLQKVKSAIANKNPNAQIYLGKLYVEGRHIKKNYSQAIKLFRKSINLGGRIELGNMYKSGLGVKKSNVVAWALTSSGGGYALRDIEKWMTRQELQAAKQLQNEMVGYYDFQQRKFITPKGVLNALDAYLEQ